ncbi:uncharacterized protein LOC144118568 [Amblyomma americanum]
MPAVCRRTRVLRLMTRAVALVILRRQERRQRKKPRWWVRPVFMARKQEGLYHTAMRRMREGDHDLFFKFYRMTPELFDELLSVVATDLSRQHVVREPLEPGERLAIALSYLASGQDISNVALVYRVGIETARQCIHAACRAIWEQLKDHFMQTPTEAEWRRIADDFTRRWQFPNCLGAVDGKHVAIVCPPNSGSRYYNYKGTYSVVLMAVVDSHCKYVLINVGGEGRFSDGGTFKNCDFGRDLSSGSLEIPKFGRLPRSAAIAPYAFVGDEAFQLRTDFMCPYPSRHLDDKKRVFNYRLSRARRCAENAFGITAARWRVLLRAIPLRPENVDYVVKATCVLHNFPTVRNPLAQTYSDREDVFGNVVAGHWRQGIQRASGDSSEPRVFPTCSHPLQKPPC